MIYKKNFQLGQKPPDFLSVVSVQRHVIDQTSVILNIPVPTSHIYVYQTLPNYPWVINTRQLELLPGQPGLSAKPIHKIVQLSVHS